jgi:hypothetical protein
VKIKMKHTILGTWHNVSDGVRAGQVVDTDAGPYLIDEAAAKRYIAAELAVPADGDAGAHF